MFLSFLWHAQAVNSNLVIKDSSRDNHQYIVRHIFELYQSHFHGLYGPVLSSENEQNTWRENWIMRGFIIFKIFVNKTLSFFTKVTSVRCFKSFAVTCLPNFSLIIWHQVRSHFLSCWDIHAFWKSHTAGWEMGRNDPAWKTSAPRPFSPTRFNNQ